MAIVTSSLINREFLYSAKANIQVPDLDREVLTATSAPSNPVWVRLSSREILHATKIQMQVSQESREVLTATRAPADPMLVRKLDREFLIKLPATSFFQNSREILMVLDKKPSIHSKINQVYEHVTQKSIVPPLAQIISYESVKQNWQLTVQKSNPLAFPGSYVFTKEFIETVVQALPITAMSYDKTGQFISLAATGALSQYIRPDDVWSKDSVAQQVVLVCQSLDIPYVPTSGLFARQNWELVVQALPVAMWTSPASVGQQSLKVVQRRPMGGLPRSPINVNESRNLVVQKLDDTPLPRSAINVNESRNLVVQQTTMPVPFGNDRAAQLIELVAQKTAMPVSIGSVRVPSERVEVVTARVEPLPISYDKVTQYTTRVITDSVYPTLDSMIVKNLYRQTRVLVVIEADYPAAGLTSPASVGEARVMFNTGLPMPTPDSIYQASKVRYVRQFVELVAQARALPLPISGMRVPSFRENVVQSFPMPAPGDMASSGSFAYQTLEQVLSTANYPDTSQVSTLSTTQVIEHVAQVDTGFPDPATLHEPVSVQQVISHAVSTDTFADPATLHSPITVTQVIGQVSLTVEYPDAGTLHAPVLAFQLVEQLTVAASYPDKDVPQSILKVTQVAQQAASVAVYPNKDTPQSLLRVTQIRENVMARDLSMYQLPEPPRRHRVRIVCRFVY